MSSSSKKTSDISGSKCWPVCTITSVKPPLERMTRLIGAALMNCGRAPTTVNIFTGFSRLQPRHEVIVLADATPYGFHIRTRPFDGFFKSFPDPHLCSKTQFPLRLLRRAESFPRPVPIPGRENPGGDGVAGQLIDQRRQIQDGSLHSRGKIVDLAVLSIEGTGDETPRHVLDKNEIAAGVAAIFQREGFMMERLPNKGGGGVPPYGVRRAPPSARAKNLSRPVHILKSRLHKRQLAAHPKVVSIQLTDELGNGVRAVMIQRRRCVLRGGNGVIERLRRHGTAGRGIHHLLQTLDLDKSVEQLEAGQGVVLVIGHRIMNRRLISMVTSQMKRVIEIRRQIAQNAIVSDAAQNEFHSLVLWHIATLRGQQVIDNQNFTGILIQKLQNKIAPDETRPTNHQNFCGLELVLHHCLFPDLMNRFDGARIQIPAKMPREPAFTA